MHGVRTRWRKGLPTRTKAKVDPEDAVRDDKEIALAETVALRMRVTRQDASNEEGVGQGAEEVEIVPDGGAEGILGRFFFVADAGLRNKWDWRESE